MKQKWTCLLYLVGLLATLGSVGCDSMGFGSDAHSVKPIVAVVKFENKAQFPMGWDLGDGFMDILVDRLVATGKFQVMERPDLDAVLGELDLQQSGLTRKQRRAGVGRLKNVEYLVKGAVVDFGHVASSSAFVSLWDVGAWGASHLAVMGVTVQVIEVESGEVIYSDMVEKGVAAVEGDVRAQYKGVSFGGGLFFRTPLGQATKSVLDDAVRGISRSIKSRPWRPRIAHLGSPRSVLVSGGRDQHEIGTVYEVYQTGELIYDPDTGDPLGRQRGVVVATIRIVDVENRHSIAWLEKGKFEDLQVGQFCRPLRVAPAATPASTRPPTPQSPSLRKAKSGILTPP